MTEGREQSGEPCCPMPLNADGNGPEMDESKVVRVSCMEHYDKDWPCASGRTPTCWPNCQHPDGPEHDGVCIEPLLTNPPSAPARVPSGDDDA